MTKCLIIGSGIIGLTTAYELSKAGHRVTIIDNDKNGKASKSAAGLLFLIFKFGVRRAISFDIPLDIACTGLLMFLFAGTFGGMMAAMVGGLVVSITLLIMKRTMTREQLMFIKTKKFPYRSLRWVEIDP